MVAINVLDLMLQLENVIHRSVQYQWTECGVIGRLDPVVKPVVGDSRQEQDHVTTQVQVMVARAVLDLMLQPENVK